METPQQRLRINVILREYWEKLRGTRPFPPESDIDQDALADIWDSCFLIKVVRSGPTPSGFRYEYLGAKLVDAFGGDVTNQEISARLIDSASPPLVRRFEKVATEGVPDLDEAEFVNKRGMAIKYRSCILPLGKEPGKVDFIIGGMKWKEG
jgi:hypothetical protein